jgi:putative flippase GtrA
MTLMTDVRERIRTVRHRAVSGKLIRYALGSVVSFGVSELTLIVLFAPHLLGARGASLVASVAGLIPGYFLNRNWAWGRRGRSDFWREVVPYWVSVVVSAVAAALAIGAVNNAVADLSRPVRTVFNAATYLAVYGVFFVLKFLLFNRLFADSGDAGDSGESVSRSDDSAAPEARYAR